MEPGDLTIDLEPDVLVLDGTKDYPISRLVVRGSMRVPADDYPITVHTTLRLHQVSVGSDAPLVKCDIAELGDEHGWFQSVRGIEAPTQDWEADGFTAGVIPDFALLMPRTGRTEVFAEVKVMEGQDPHRVIGAGECTLPLQYPDPGYLDWDADELDGDRHVASLAVATAAVDGAVHQSEVNVIRRYFRTRYEGRPDVDELRAKVSLTLQRSLRRLETGAVSPARLIEDASSVLLHEYPIPVRRSAYMLAVRVAAADRIIAEQERGLLEVVASSLGLPIADMESARDLIRAEALFVATFVRSR